MKKFGQFVKSVFNFFLFGAGCRSNPLINRQTPTACAIGVSYGEPGDVLLSLEIQPTIIGAEVFHGPVRNGKAWFHNAMVTGQSLNSFGNEMKRAVRPLDSKFSSRHKPERKSFTVIGSSCTSN